MLQAMQRQQGELGLNKKTRSLVRSPLLHPSPQEPWQCLLQTPEGGVSVHSVTDGHSLGCHGSTSERKRRKLRAEGQGLVGNIYVVN